VATGDEPAYVSVDRTRSETTVREFGGSADALVGLLDQVFERFAIDTATIRSPPRHRLNSLFRDLSTYWETAPLRKFNIRRLTSLLAGFGPQLTRRLKTTARPGTVVIGLTGARQCTRIAWDGREVTVESTTAEPDLTLARRELVNAFFGDSDLGQDDRERFPLLDTACPLAYYVWHSECV